MCRQQPKICKKKGKIAKGLVWVGLINEDQTNNRKEFKNTPDQNGKYKNMHQIGTKPYRLKHSLLPTRLKNTITITEQKKTLTNRKRTR